MWSLAASWHVSPLLDMDKVRFGIIGCGSIAKRAFIPALKKSNVAELIAVASRDREKAKAISIQFECDAESTYESLLQRNDINAVYIATIPSTHEEIILSAAKTGKHIICEKPLTVSYSSAKRIIDYCSKIDVRVFEGFMYQFHRQHQIVKDIVNDGKIGRPILFQAAFGFPPLDQNNFRYKRDLGGGALLDAGSYTIHSARNFFRREPKNIQSSISCDGSEVDLHGSALLDFGSGQTALLSFGFNNYYQNTYKIWGTDGMITLKRAFSIPHDMNTSIFIEQQGSREEVVCKADDHFLNEIEYFCNAVKENIIHAHWNSDILNQAKAIQQIMDDNHMKNSRSISV